MQVKHCTACGKDLIEGASFCASCGAPVKSEAPSHCTSCGAELAEGAPFCASCGASVKGGSQGLEKQEKVYPMRFQSPIFAALGSMLIILAIIGAVVANIYAYELAELRSGKPEAPPGSLLHAWEVGNIEDFANVIRTASLAFIALCSVILLLMAILASLGRYMREIALTDAGIVLRRWGLGPWGRPVVIRTISEMKEVSRGRALRLDGVTPEGRRITRLLTNKDTGGERWEEFKNDLQAYIAPTDKE